MASKRKSGNLSDYLFYDTAIAYINKSFVWAHYQAQFSVSYRRTVYMYLLLELLFVKFGYLSVSCLSQGDITYTIDSICMS